MPARPDLWPVDHHPGHELRLTELADRGCSARGIAFVSEVSSSNKRTVQERGIPSDPN